jgi:hypothetical protein
MMMSDNRSRLYQLADQPDHQRIVMGDDDRLPQMPKAPTLIDFFKHRFSVTDHLLQSARLAQSAGHNEKIVTACLLHDIAVAGFIRGDHGYYGEQLIQDYVDPEIAWAVRTHQALRFYADDSVGYTYPQRYREWFGDDYRPDPYIEHEYQQARRHKWYMTSRLVCLNDLYSFDPTVHIDVEEFTDVIGRNFKQPKEGLGFDGSSSAHMWRTIIRPNKFL